MSQLLTVFADASFSESQGVRAGGYAFWARGDEPQPVRGSGEWPCDTIQEAETVGLAVALMNALDSLTVQEGGGIVLQSDSCDALGVFLSFGATVARTSDYLISVRQGNEVSRAFVEKALSLCPAGVRVFLKHVKAHTGAAAARSQVNAWCDSEAKRQRRLLWSRLYRASQSGPQLPRTTLKSCEYGAEEGT